MSRAEFVEVWTDQSLQMLDGALIIIYHRSNLRPFCEVPMIWEGFVMIQLIIDAHVEPLDHTE